MEETPQANILGVGELLNTKMVSKTDINGKEMRFIFGKKMHQMDQ